jgi:hypothetical protein
MNQTPQCIMLSITNKYINIIDIVNISKSSKEFNKECIKIIQEYLFFLKVGKIKIIQGTWNPYCIVNDSDIKEYSILFWEEFLGKNPYTVSQTELSIIIAFFNIYTSLSSMRTYGPYRHWYATTYSNGLIKQLQTTSGYVRYNKECDITIETNYCKEEDAKISFNLTEEILSTYIIRQLIHKKFNKTKIFNQADTNLSRWLELFYYI